MHWLLDAPGSPRFGRYRASFPFGRLVQSRLGLIKSIAVVPTRLGEPDIVGLNASLGDLSYLAPNLQREETRAGTGGDLDTELAWVRAVVEAAERYATLVYDEADFVVDSARNLGSNALALNTIPRCSEAELARPECPMRLPDDSQPIRWVQGWSLVRRRAVFVPAIMVHLSMVPWPAERFWLQISTGCAGHTNLTSALVGALCESVERDAIALTWLARLPLPEISWESVADPNLTAAIERSAVRFRCYDATTDLGIPTVFSVQTPKRAGSGAPVSVSCATAPSLESAITKALREACPLRSVLYEPRSIPTRIEDFRDVIHGAAHYASGHDLSAFDFLLGERPFVLPRPTIAPSLSYAETPEDRLRTLVDILRSHDMDAVAVDLTCDELEEVGLSAVRVITPELMPMSFVHRARFLGTPRLHRYWARAVGGTHREVDVNPHPLPFA